MGAGVAFAQVGIVGFDRQMELDALRLFALPVAASADLYAWPEGGKAAYLAPDRDNDRCFGIVLHLASEQA
jgi:hypothetical protein